ncbi:MAG: hypothetical protein ABH846_01925 [Patescibacteria group bacterium]
MLRDAVVDLPKKVSGGGRVSEDAHVALRHNGCYFYFVIDVHGVSKPNDKKLDLALNAEKRRFARYIESEFAIACYRFGDPQKLNRVFSEITKMIDITFSDGHFGAAVAGCVIDEDGVTIVHLGDSRVYAFDPDITKGYRQLTVDHNPANPVELARLRELDPKQESFRVIVHPIVKRPIRADNVELRLHYVNGQGKESDQSIAMTRGFGDKLFRPAFCQLPEINWWPHNRFPPEAILAVCSDGASQAVEDTFGYYANIDVQPDAAACKFRCESLLHNYGPADDATAIFIPLKEEATEELAFFKH